MPFFGVPFVFLMNRTFPFNLFFDWLIGFSFFEEILRFVSTKFATLLLLAYILYFIFFLRVVFETVNKYLSLIIGLTVLIALLFFIAPIFGRDNFISAKLKVKIPQQYFDFWAFMKEQKDGIVLSLPLYNFSGWQYYQWGYQGSGFIWFGLKQSILDRDFDRWNVSNEQVFREFHYALYAENHLYFAENLKKYNVRYILWDKNIITPYEKNRPQILYGREITALMKKLEDDGVSKIAQFGNLIVFENRHAEKKISLKIISTSIEPSYRWGNADQAYYRFGDYVTAQNQAVHLPIYYYPFRTYVNKSDRLNDELIQFDALTYSYTLKNTEARQFSKILAPNFADTEAFFYTYLYIKKTKPSGFFEIILEPILPKNLAVSIHQPLRLSLDGNKSLILLNNQRYEVSRALVNEKEPLYFGQATIKTREPNFVNGETVAFSPSPYRQLSQRFAPYQFFGKLPITTSRFDAYAIYNLNKKQVGITVDKSTNVLRFNSQNKQTGVYLDLSDLNHQTGYILKLTARNREGLPLRICLKNIYSRICTLYDKLSSSKEFVSDIFIIPPTDANIGYGLSIDNLAFSDLPTTNELKEIIIAPFPYNFLSEIYFTNNLNTEKDLRQPIVVFNQSYAQGWKAYSVKIPTSKLKFQNSFKTLFPFVFGKELKNHVLVNNWANGWRLNEINATNATNAHQLQPMTTVVIIFLPQYLEFLGFGILIVTFICMLRMKKTD